MATKFTHHDNPPTWVVALREQFKSSVFCGCYEGDMSGEWAELASPGQTPDYTVDEGYPAVPITSDYVMGPGQRRLIEFITAVKAGAYDVTSSP